MMDATRISIARRGSGTHTPDTERQGPRGRAVARWAVLAPGLVGRGECAGVQGVRTEGGAGVAGYARSADVGGECDAGDDRRERADSALDAPAGTGAHVLATQATDA